MKPDCDTLVFGLSYADILNAMPKPAFNLFAWVTLALVVVTTAAATRPTWCLREFVSTASTTNAATCCCCDESVPVLPPNDPFAPCPDESDCCISVPASHESARVEHAPDARPWACALHPAVIASRASSVLDPRTARVFAALARGPRDSSWVCAGRPSTQLNV